MALAAAAFAAGCATASTPVPALKIDDGPGNKIDPPSKTFDPEIGLDVQKMLSTFG
jgi:hypothetical protein